MLESAAADREQLVERVARLQAALAQVTAERDKLRRAYEQVQQQLELLRRRIFVAKAERIDATQLELEFAETRAKLDALATQIGDSASPVVDDAPPVDPGGETPPPSTTRPEPSGRRNLAAEDMPEERVEILDPVYEGQVERIGFEENCKVRYRRGGYVRVVVARATYKTATAAASQPSDPPAMTRIFTVPIPKELFPRSLFAPSMIAHVLVQKYRWGLPFHRQARMCAAEGFPIDDGTMCRYAEDAGATLGCIVDAMAKEAKATAFWPVDRRDRRVHPAGAGPRATGVSQGPLLRSARRQRPRLLRVSAQAHQRRGVRDVPELLRLRAGRRSRHLRRHLPWRGARQRPGPAPTRGGLLEPLPKLAGHVENAGPCRAYLDAVGRAKSRR